ncbi:MAG: PQQ-binding-like beta-propeller repeat protein [Bacteroidota bacterium]
MRLLFLAFLLASCAAETQNWPQPSGPNGTWQITIDQEPPLSFSVAEKKNTLWTSTLPEGGQSAIVVWGDRIFLSIMKPATSEKIEDLMGSDIVALCLDATDGTILWQSEIKGSVKSPYMYGFSDSTSPGPVTDGEKVWFFNSSGNITGFDFEGNKLWERKWDPIEELNGIEFPFNKQFEPFLIGDILVNMEPYMEQDGEREFGWNYLYGLDKNTGEVIWISEDGLTHYNTPFYSKDVLGRPTVLIGRGGHHQIPEEPRGYSMIDLSDGKNIWRYQTDEGMALYHSVFNKDYAVWYTESENELHVLNSNNGELLKKISLTDHVDVRGYDTVANAYKFQEGINYQEQTGFNVFPGWYTNMIIGDQLFFMCFKEGRHRKGIGPAYSFARVNLKSGRVEYLEVPVFKDSDREIWQQNLVTETINSRGLDVSQDKRSRRNGWHWCFNGNPIAINGKIYYTTMLGVCYIIDSETANFDREALVSVNDLGPLGKTWSLNTPSYANGKLYHRTLKELICIGK